MRVRYTRRALQHLAALRRFSTDRFGARTTDAALAKISAMINTLADHPNRGRPGRVAGTRELVMPGLTFIVAYQTTAHTVDILAIMHGAQRWPDELD